MDKKHFIFSLHALLDPFIRDELGNVHLETLKLFGSLGNFPVSKVIQDSIRINEHFKRDISALEGKIRAKQKALLYSEKGYLKDQEANWEEIKSTFIDGFNNCFEKFWNMAMEEEFLIILSGWQNVNPGIQISQRTPKGGHGVCFTIEKNSSDNSPYILTLCNSGAGLNYHPRKGDLCGTIVSFTSTKERIKNMLRDILKLTFLFGEKTTNYNEQGFYRTFEKFFKISEGKSQFSAPQLAGSCTYNSCYLAIKSLCRGKYETVFEEEIDRINSKLANKLEKSSDLISDLTDIRVVDCLNILNLLSLTRQVDYADFFRLMNGIGKGEFDSGTSDHLAALYCPGKTNQLIRVTSFAEANSNMEILNYQFVFSENGKDTFTLIQFLNQLHRVHLIRMDDTDLSIFNDMMVKLFESCPNYGTIRDVVSIASYTHDGVYRNNNCVKDVEVANIFLINAIRFAYLLIVLDFMETNMGLSSRPIPGFGLRVYNTFASYTYQKSGKSKSQFHFFLRDFDVGKFHRLCDKYGQYLISFFELNPKFDPNQYFGTGPLSAEAYRGCRNTCMLIKANSSSKILLPSMIMVPAMSPLGFTKHNVGGRDVIYWTADFFPSQLVTGPYESIESSLDISADFDLLEKKLVATSLEKNFFNYAIFQLHTHLIRVPPSYHEYPSFGHLHQKNYIASRYLALNEMADQLVKVESDLELAYICYLQIMAKGRLDPGIHAKVLKRQSNSPYKKILTIVLSIHNLGSAKFAPGDDLIELIIGSLVGIQEEGSSIYYQLSATLVQRLDITFSVFRQYREIPPGWIASSPKTFSDHLLGKLILVEKNGEKGVYLPDIQKVLPYQEKKVDSETRYIQITSKNVEGDCCLLKKPSNSNSTSIYLTKKLYTYFKSVWFESETQPGHFDILLINKNKNTAVSTIQVRQKRIYYEDYEIIPDPPVVYKIWEIDTPCMVGFKNHRYHIILLPGAYTNKYDSLWLQDSKLNISVERHIISEIHFSGSHLIVGNRYQEFLTLFNLYNYTGNEYCLMNMFKYYHSAFSHLGEKITAFNSPMRSYYQKRLGLEFKEPNMAHYPPRYLREFHQLPPKTYPLPKINGQETTTLCRRLKEKLSPSMVPVPEPKGLDRALYDRHLSNVYRLSFSGAPFDQDDREGFLNRRNELFRELADKQLINVDREIPEMVLNYHDLFYELLLINKILEFISLGDDSKWIQLLESIDPEFTDTDSKCQGTKGGIAMNREPILVLTEIATGMIVRGDQLAVISSIRKEIEGRSSKKIHELLMGRGKSSFITPYLVLQILWILDKRVFIILPSSPPTLQQEAMNNLLGAVNYYTPQKCSIHLCGNIGRTGVPSFLGEWNHHVVISSDRNLKRSFLNYVEQLNQSTLKFYAKDDSFFIFDEIDAMEDPSKSELNYPVSGNCLIDQYEDLVNLVSTVLTDCFRSTNFREIDIVAIKKNEKLRKIIETVGEMVAQYSELKDFCSGREKEDLIKCGFLHYFAKKIKGAFRLIHLKNYGFLKLSDHLLESMTLKKIRIRSEFFQAIPFEDINRPSIGSRFNDFMTVIILTYLSFLYYLSDQKRFRALDYKMLHLHLKHKMRFSALNSTDTRIMGLLGLNTDLKTVDSTEFARFKSFDKFASNESMKDAIEILDYYMKYILKPAFGFSERQLNTSFYEMMSSLVSIHKTAFSGTTFFDLPVFLNDHQEFLGKSVDYQAEGSILRAFLGVLNASHPSKIFIRESPSLETVLDVLKEKPYLNALIDTGAYLRHYRREEIVTKIREITNRDVVFIDAGNKMVLRREGQTIPLSGVRLSQAKDVFVYYDTENTRGVDIVLPKGMHGLVTISYFNSYTSIAQGMFRLRQLNAGHAVSFLLAKEVNGRASYQNIEFGKVEQLQETDLGLLYRYLRDKETQFGKSKDLLKLVQNVKLLKRMSKPKNRSSYLDEIIQPIAVRQDLLDIIKLNVPFNEKVFFDRHCQGKMEEKFAKICQEADSLMASSTILDKPVEIEAEEEAEEEVEVQKAEDVVGSRDQPTDFELKISFELSHYLDPGRNSTSNFSIRNGQVLTNNSTKCASQFFFLGKKVYISTMLVFLLIKGHISAISRCYLTLQLGDQYIICSKREILHILIADRKMTEKVVWDTDVRKANADPTIAAIEYLFGNVPIHLLKKVVSFGLTTGMKAIASLLGKLSGSSVKHFPHLLENYDRAYWTEKAHSGDPAKRKLFLSAFNIATSEMSKAEFDPYLMLIGDGDTPAKSGVGVEVDDASRRTPTVVSRIGQTRDETKYDVIETAIGIQKFKTREQLLNFIRPLIVTKLHFTQQQADKLIDSVRMEFLGGSEKTNQRLKSILKKHLNQE
jgi:hypothetical protein